jgi:alginate O-acetyltransferase complex protein AlgJ
VTRIPDREAQAKAEMAATRVGRATRWMLVAAFLAILLAGVALERWAPTRRFEPGAHRIHLRPPTWSGWLATWRESGPRAASRELREFLRRIDEWSERDLAIGRRLRPPVQRFLLERFRYGNSQVRAGRDGWLFYEREIDSLTGPPFLDHASAERARLGDPEAELRAFGGYLRGRGVALAVVPAPAKAAIEIAHLLGDGAPGHPIRNPAFDELARRLAAAGIALFDPAPLLFEATRGGTPMYLTNDSHWRPEAVDRVAAALAAEIFARGVLPRPASPRFHRTREAVVGRPDLVRLLGLPAEGAGPRYEEVEIQVVRGADGQLFRPGPADDAPILLLGDSLAGIYGWGEQHSGSGAGLAEQLAYHLQTPVEAILEPAGGSVASRERLAALLRRGRDPLAGKRLVILELAERELAIGPWRPARFRAAEAAEPDR